MESTFNFNTMEFNPLSAFSAGFEQSAGTIAEESFMKPVEGNTSTGGYDIFADDEGIDTMGSSFEQQTFDPIFATLRTDTADYTMQQNLSMDNTMGRLSAWNSHSQLALSPAIRLDDFSNTNTTSFDSMSMYRPQQLGKRSLQLDLQDFPQPKRHESAEYAAFSPFLASESVTGSSWTLDAQPTPSSTTDIGLTDEAADVCATWFSKYAVLPSDRHIESLSQLTGESHNAIRHWFGQMLKQGMAGHDSAYKSQTSLSQQDQVVADLDTSFQTTATEISCNHDTQASTSQVPAPRGGRKGCKPTSRPELLSRDANKIYQCTRKCGKRYGRKCDWKRNEEEGYPSKSWTCNLCVRQGIEKVKPCFRKYHFSQHFRNIHPGLNSADYEAESVVHSDSSFPRRCGFCTHRFISRQDRIDHIADHFKRGKCMLDWNDDEDDNADSDNMDDDDDDRPDSDGFDGASDEQLNKDNQDSPGPKQNGNDNNDRDGQHPSSGFGQFQLSQLMNNTAGDQELGVCQQSSSWNKQLGASDSLGDDTEPEHQCSLQAQSSLHEQCSSRSYSRSVEAEGGDMDPMARDDVTSTLVNTNTQRQIPFEALHDLTVPSMDLRLQQCSHESSFRTRNGKDNSKLTEAISESSTVDMKEVYQDVGRDSTPSSRISPVTRALLLEEEMQPDGKLDVESGLLSKSSSENIPRDRLRSLTLEGGGIRESTLFILLGHLMGQLKSEGQNPDRRHARLRDLSDALTGKTITLEIEKVVAVDNVKSKIQDISFAPVKRPKDGETLDELVEEPSSLQSKTTGCGLLMQDIGRLDPLRIFNVTSSDVTASIPDQNHPVVCIALATTDKSVVKSEYVSKNTSSPITTNSIGLEAPVTNFSQKSQTFLSIRLLGTGGFSTVDEVIHRETNLRVGRKTLKNREPSAMEELKKEVKVLQKLRHPHIIRFLDAYSKGDKMSILLSPVAETTLAVWLERSLAGQPTGSADTIVKMFGCLVSSVRYLHEQRPVVKHMDIKPQNILVMHGNQKFPHIVLSDFGVSSSDEDVSPDGRKKPLTRQYCAPEVPSGIARTRAADIWSLGCVLVEMAATAFGQDNSQWLDFRHEFGGSEGKYYWQNIPRLHEWLSGFLEKASTPMEATAVVAVTAMLNSEPTERPDAATLTMVFTPAPCCLGWANEKASFPGPEEELEMVEMLVHDDVIDCHAQHHVCGSANHAQKLESFTQAQSWLDKCSLHHEVCRQHVSDAGFLPTRLVDLQPEGTECSSESVIRIINSADIEPTLIQTSYAAISHVWDRSDAALSGQRLHLMQNAFSLDILTNAVKDAMTAAQNIGYRYVWIDSLCILQDSQDDKWRECAAMASVYRNAALTIVTHATSATASISTSDGLAQAMSPKSYRSIATNMSWIGRPTEASSHGAPLSSNPIDSNVSEHEFSVDTRSWSLQERLLSRRLLHLAGKQMYWECNALKASETFPCGMSPLLWEKVHTKSSSPSTSTSTPTVRSGLTSMPPSMITPMLRKRRFSPRFLRNSQYIRKQADVVNDSMSAQLRQEIRTGDQGKNLAFGIEEFEHGRNRYNESRTPVLGNFGSSRKDSGINGGGFQFDFDFEAPRSINANRPGKYQDRRGNRNLAGEIEDVDVML